MTKSSGNDGFESADDSAAPNSKSDDPAVSNPAGDKPSDSQASDAQNSDAQNSRMQADGTGSAGPEGSPEEDEGPGWLPAIMAASVLMGMVGFVACGFTTWLLYQKRSELGARTLRATYVPAVEQSLMNPDEKQAVIKQFNDFAKALETGKYENWQAAGVLQRIVRLPVLQWGDLEAIEAYAKKSGQEELATEARRQLSRLRRAVELDSVVAMDVEDVLDPATETAETMSGRQLVEPLTDEIVKEVILRAKLLADRSEVPDQDFDDVRIDTIVRRQIEIGVREGSF